MSLKFSLHRNSLAVVSLDDTALCADLALVAGEVDLPDNSLSNPHSIILPDFRNLENSTTMDNGAACGFIQTDTQAGIQAAVQ